MSDLVIKAEVSPSELREHLLLNAYLKRPTMVWGPPAIGKSDIMRSVAEELGATYMDFRALLYESVDIKGIPAIRDNQAVWYTPDFLPPSDSTDSYLINIEELPAAFLSVQTALYQLVLDRKVGTQYTLPEKAIVFACGNRGEDGGMFHAMPPALRSRFAHFCLAPNLDDWIGWAIDHDMPTELLFFLHHKPAPNTPCLLYTSDAADE